MTFEKLTYHKLEDAPEKRLREPLKAAYSIEVDVPWRKA